MLYSNPCEYAIRAMTELALRPDAGWVPVTTIASAADLPSPYLGKILKDLVRARLLRSTRGPGGGYQLARPASEITLLDVKLSVDGPDDLERCAVGLDPCTDETPCPLHNDFVRVRATIHEYLTSTSLADVAAGATEKEQLLSGS
ncbi:MAG: Rrf2 family transcriptional regulator [Gemmatimonadota bacterium]|nr:Rrf2 family transcriptional regulator [Gemmatimonadota bacterium]MDH3427370.1 Rrf2 family transcriptional regulator [Gemmatimonadota bacterium]